MYKEYGGKRLFQCGMVKAICKKLKRMRARADPRDDANALGDLFYEDLDQACVFLKCCMPFLT